MYNDYEVRLYYGVKDVCKDLMWLAKTYIAYTDKKMTLEERCSIDYWFATARARLGTHLALIYRCEEVHKEFHGESKITKNLRGQEKRLAFVIRRYYKLAKKLNKLDDVYSCWNGRLGVNALYPNVVEPLMD